MEMIQTEKIIERNQLWAQMGTARNIALKIVDVILDCSEYECCGEGLAALSKVAQEYQELAKRWRAVAK